MRGMSYVHIAGTVGSPPQMRTTREGKPWCRLRLAVTRWEFSSQQEVTDWWTIRLYGKNAERAVKILKQGVGAVFRGMPQLDEWTDNEGKQRSDLSVAADTFTVVRYPQGPRTDGLQPMPLPPTPTATYGAPMEQPR